MTYQEIGIYGASRQSWKEDPARALLLEIYQANKGKSDKELAALFLEEALENTRVTTSALEYFATNGLNRLRAEFPDSESAIKRARMRQESTKRVHEIKQNIKERMVMLGLTMPNGKVMRYCTGTEMIGFGGWYAKIGKKVGRKMVGQVLNEDEIWKLK